MKSLALCFTLLTVSLHATSNPLEHNIGNFGDSTLTIRTNLDGRCDELTERKLSLLLSVVKKDQTQLECDGFLYKGKKRFVELMFSDGHLDIIHIMGTESDHEELKDILSTKYGEPSFSSNQVDYYHSKGISLRKKPHEISFVSKRVREQYDQYMRSLP